MKICIYRANLAPSIHAARTWISHKHFLLNGKPVNIAAHKIKPGDVISVREKSRNLPMIQECIARKDFVPPHYIEVSADRMSVTFVKVPTMDEVSYPFTPQFHSVIEYYSK